MATHALFLIAILRVHIFPSFTFNLPMLLNLKWVPKQHEAGPGFFSTPPGLLPQAAALRGGMQDGPRWGCLRVFRKCQDSLELSSAIYNPAQKCSLTLSICSGFGTASLKYHDNDLPAWAQPPSCVLAPLWGSPFSLYFPGEGGKEPGMYQLGSHPKSGTPFTHTLAPCCLTLGSCSRTAWAQAASEEALGTCEGPEEKGTHCRISSLPSSPV